MIWFTSDEHYHHRNILGYCDRPFADVDEMNETLIANHNEVVGDDDTVYHLGDFAFFRNCDISEWIELLNGEHIFVRGNHDKWIGAEDMPYMIETKFKLNRLTETGKHHKQKVTMCHYPMYSWNGSFHGAWHLYGHVHGRFDHPGLALDVGVDSWKYYPISLDQIEEVMNERTNQKRVDGSMEPK